MKIIKSIFKFGVNIADARTLHKDTEKKDKVVRYGIISIFNSILTVALVSLLVFGANMLFGQGGLGELIIGGILALIGIAGAITSLLNAIFYTILQFIVNKKAMSWIALVVLILAIGASVIIAWKIIVL